MQNKSSSFVKIIVIIIGFYIGISVFSGFVKGFIEAFTKPDDEQEYAYNDDTFSLITTPENKILEETIKKNLDKSGFDVKIVYADNLDIVTKLNSGEKYDPN